MDSLQDIWKGILDKVAEGLTSTTFNTWFSDCVPVELEDSRLVVRTTTDFKRRIIVSRYGDIIRDALKDLFSCDFELTVLTEEEFEDYVPGVAKNDDLPEMAGYTFDRFIVGVSNQLAHAAAVAVAEHPGGKNYNPLFIYGNSGLGKTHLLLAIGTAIREKNPSVRIAYVKGDEFTNQMVQAVQSGTAEDFRQKYRNVDLFLVDDIQFIAGKERTQEEFFHTFNNIYEAGHQIVLTSDRPPKDMIKLEDRLRTRFEWGVIADVQPPDLETRIAITYNKAGQLGIVLDEDAVLYIAENLTSNIRQIEGVVKRLTAYRDLLNDTITTDTVKRAIRDVTRIGIYIPTPDIIIEETARYYSLAPEDLKGQRRSKNMSMARHVSMYLIRSLTNLSLKDIGEQFGDRNYTTVLSSVRKIEDLLKTDKEMAVTVRDITSNINAKS